MKIIILLTSVALLYYFGLPYLANKMAFHPPAVTVQYPDNTIDVNVAPEISLKAVYMENPDAEYTVVFAHGNGQDLSSTKDILDMFFEQGFSVLSYDYRGYGKSGGKPDTKKLEPDVIKIIDFAVLNLGIDVGKIIVWGHSLGSVPAFGAAANFKVAAVVCQGGFSSAHKLVGIPFPVATELDNTKRLGKIKAPAVFIHGQLDRVIPFSHGQTLYELFSGPKEKIWLESAGHNDIPFDTYQQASKTALDLIKQTQ